MVFHQGKYFKDEQEYAVMRRRDWLRDRGELERYGIEAARERRKSARLVTPNVLTEILGHSVRFAPRRAAVERGPAARAEHAVGRWSASKLGTFGGLTLVR